MSHLSGGRIMLAKEKCSIKWVLKTLCVHKKVLLKKSVAFYIFVEFSFAQRKVQLNPKINVLEN